RVLFRSRRGHPFGPFLGCPARASKARAGPGSLRTGAEGPKRPGGSICPRSYRGFRCARTLLLVLLGASTIANDLVEDVLDGVHGHHVHGRQVGLVTRRITVHARGPEHCQVVPHDLGGGLAVAVLESGGLLVCLSEQEP